MSKMIPAEFCRSAAKKPIKVSRHPSVCRVTCKNKEGIIIIIFRSTKCIEFAKCIYIKQVFRDAN